MKSRYRAALNPAESEEADRTIVKLVQEGWDDVRIGRILGLNKSTIGNRLRRLGLALGNPARRDGGDWMQEERVCSEMDRRVRVYRSLCAGYESWIIAEEEGLTIMQVEVYRKQMPKWWDRDYKLRATWFNN